MASQVKGSIIKENAIFVKPNSRMICSEKNNSEKMYIIIRGKRLIHYRRISCTNQLFHVLLIKKITLVFIVT